MLYIALCYLRVQLALASNNVEYALRELSGHCPLAGDVNIYIQPYEHI